MVSSHCVRTTASITPTQNPWGVGPSILEKQPITAVRPKGNAIVISVNPTMNLEAGRSNGPSLRPAITSCTATVYDSDSGCADMHNDIHTPSISIGDDDSRGGDNSGKQI